MDIVSLLPRRSSSLSGWDNGQCSNKSFEFNGFIFIPHSVASYRNASFSSVGLENLDTAGPKCLTDEPFDTDFDFCIAFFSIYVKV
jgi:hypothetical protein